MQLTSKLGNTYSTDQGDIWDIIALRTYGLEHAMHRVMEENFEERFTDVFKANVLLDIFSTAEVAINFRAATKIPNLRDLLPWR
jgi:ABC-type uncharacterized transport system ATPase subunit